jgi:hypothetical protein
VPAAAVVVVVVVAVAAAAAAPATAVAWLLRYSYNGWAMRVVDWGGGVSLFASCLKLLRRPRPCQNHIAHTTPSIHQPALAPPGLTLSCSSPRLPCRCSSSLPISIQPRPAQPPTAISSQASSSIDGAVAKLKATETPPDTTPSQPRTPSVNLDRSIEWTALVVAETIDRGCGRPKRTRCMPLGWWWFPAIAYSLGILRLAVSSARSRSSSIPPNSKHTQHAQAPTRRQQPRLPTLSTTHTQLF